MTSEHRHIPAPLLEWVDGGLIPEGALLGALLAMEESAPALRDRWLGEARRRLRKDDPRGYRGVAIGFLGLAEAAPRAWRRAEGVVGELRRLTGEAAAERRAERLADFHALLRTPAMFDLLIEEARARIGVSPDEAGGWLRLAGLAFAGLRRAELPPSLVAERALRLAAHEANLLRVRGELPAAAAAFAALEGDPRWREVTSLAAHAEGWSLRGSAHSARRDFEAAARLLERTETVARVFGDARALARALLKRGSLADHAGDFRAAVALHRAAARLLDPGRDPRLYWASQHNLADSLLSLGRVELAARLAAAAREGLARCADEALRLRAAWLEGRIARALGHPRRAAAKLRQVAQGWMAQERPYDGALARLDLARLDVARGLRAGLKRRVRTLAAEFCAREVDREAREALALAGAREGR